jgi:hypothetical protein
MDLGAPILDVQASVVSSAETTATAKTAAPTKIISGGVVSAPGYKPITITVDVKEPEIQESVFIPDIPIM